MESTFCLLYQPSFDRRWQPEKGFPKPSWWPHLVGASVGCGWWSNLFRWLSPIIWVAAFGIWWRFHAIFQRQLPLENRPVDQAGPTKSLFHIIALEMFYCPELKSWRWQQPQIAVAAIRSALCPCTTIAVISYKAPNYAIKFLKLPVPKG